MVGNSWLYLTKKVTAINNSVAHLSLNEQREVFFSDDGIRMVMQEHQLWISRAGDGIFAHGRSNSAHIGLIGLKIVIESSIHT